MTSDAWLAIAVRAAEEAGTVLMGYFGQALPCEDKGLRDVVCAADRAAEDHLLRTLRGHFPDHRIVSEETGELAGDGAFTWYVDPLDGTKNFIRGNPAFCTTLALERDGEMALAVVHDPTRQETFVAERGGGAYRGTQRLRVAATARLEDALLTTGYPSAGRHRGGDPTLYFRIAMAIQGTRRSGSSALDMAYVAAGRLDGFWEIALAPWDVAAGVLLVREAGGACTEFCGQPWHTASPNLLAANPRLHVLLLELFAG